LKENDNITIGRTILKFLTVSEKESYTDVDDQKISMVIPLSDEFKLEKKEKIVSSELEFLTDLTALGKNLITASTLEDSFDKVGDLIFKFR